MKEAVTKVIDTLSLEDFHGALQKLLELYNKCIAAGGDYFEWDKSFISILSIKVPIREKSGNLFIDPRIYREKGLQWLGEKDREEKRKRERESVREREREREKMLI